MRIRSIKPEFFHHEGLFEAERETNLPLRVAFIGLWCAADREGRFKWEPRRLGIQILPYDTGVDFSRVLHALTTRGFVQRYACRRVEYGCIPSFGRHQVINNREAASILPSITDPEAEITPISEEIDACPTRAPRVNDACPTRAKGKGREGKEGVPQNDASLTREELALEVETTQPPPSEHKRPRKELLDALVAIDGSNPLKATSPAFAQAAKALQIIKEVSPDVTAEEIGRRAKVYKLKMAGATISPTALAKHWALCEEAARNGKGGIQNI